MTTNDNELRILEGVDTLKIELRPLTSLKIAKRNARTHSKKQIAQIAASISQFGFNVPLLVDTDGVIVAGHGRFQAAQLLGYVDLPVIPIGHLSPAEIRVFALADNKIASLAGWDDDILRIEFEELQTACNFDLEITGFSTTEIDLLSEGPRSDDKLELLPTLDRRKSIGVETGDLWLLGKHKLLCGDSRDSACFATLMGHELARMVFSDPPFNVKIDGHVGGMGEIKHPEFAMASGEMSKTEFTEFLRVAFANAATVSIDGAIHFQCMDWRHMGEMLDAGHAVYSGLQNMCVWAKDNGGMGSFYRSSTNSCSSGSAAPRRISIRSSWARTVAIARTCGTTAEPRRRVPMPSLRCTRR